MMTTMRIADGAETGGTERLHVDIFGSFKMRKNFRRLFWVEVALAAITGLLALITPIFPDWIEFVSGWDPDQHDGSVEWMIVVGLFVVTIVIVALATIEWRRTPATIST
jgi:uncharacterized membrane protein